MSLPFTRELTSTAIPYVPRTLCVRKDVDSAKKFLLEKCNREPNNGKPYALLAELENHMAKYHNAMAAEYAKSALSRDHSLKKAHSELTEAMRRACDDWCAQNHYELIEYYKDFVKEHPDYIPGYMWLLDQLLDDNRLDEASYYVQILESKDGTYRTLLFKAILALHLGDIKQVKALIDKMELEYSDCWIMYLCLGDLMVALGDHEKAIHYWRKYRDLHFG